MIKSPDSDETWAAYYELRWRILRAPWQQPRGSERDEFDATAVHRCVLDESNKMIAIGRLHFIDDQISQIRYMAVDDSYQRQGAGTQILQALEIVAQQEKYTTIQLHAREISVSFYRRHGYQILGKSHLLYNEIQHYLMQKELHA
jgi:predicted GNAT family N-acyltransferase